MIIRLKKKGINGSSSPEQGLTLVEVLISVALILILIAAAAQTILNGQFLASYSKHKIQVTYAGQQILEQQRQQTFVGNNSQTTAPVIIDTYGNYTNPSNYFYGTAKIKTTNLDTYRNHVDVEIDWPEQILAGIVTMKEYFSTDIANDPIPN